MTKLLEGEMRAARLIITEQNEEVRERLLSDLEQASIHEVHEDRSLLEFLIEGYDRPPARVGQNALIPEGEVVDSDGAVLEVILYSDANGRLLEFEVVRYEEGPVIRPDWRTFKTRMPPPII